MTLPCLSNTYTHPIRSPIVRPRAPAGAARHSRDSSRAAKTVSALIAAAALWSIALVAGAATGTTDCSNVGAAEARLACYDRQAGKATTDTTNAEATSSAMAEPAARRGKATIEPVTVEPARPDDAKPTRNKRRFSIFGRNKDKKKADKPPKKKRGTIVSEITEVRRTSLGRHIITLANGQTWVENEITRGPTVSVGEAVTVEHLILRKVLRSESGTSLFVREVD